jgi:hypothetical protein
MKAAMFTIKERRFAPICHSPASTDGALESALTSGRPAGMAHGVRTFRLGIAVFNQPDTMWPALIALLDGGLALRQVCLAARPAALARLPQSAHPYSSSCDSLGPVVDKVKAFDSAHATARSHASLVVHFGGSRDDSDWRRQELADNVLEQVFDDVIVLGVSSESTRQQLVTTRILLGHSSHRVLTQEFTLPAKH